MADSDLVEKVLEIEIRLKRQEKLMDRITAIMSTFHDKIMETYNIKEKENES